MMKRKLSVLERLVLAGPDRRTTEGDGHCWIWQGSRDAKGYGFIKVDGKCRRVHIVAWELANGEPLNIRGPSGVFIGPERTVEHTCRNTSCWRPSHLEALTRSENTARGNRANPRSTEKARAAKRRAGGDWTPEELRAVDPVFDDGHGGIG